MASNRPTNKVPYFAHLQAKVQCFAAATLGLALIFLPPNLTLHNPIAHTISTRILHQPVPTPRASIWGAPGTASSETVQLCALSGVFSCAISLAYGISIYHGFDEWIYISVSGRLCVAGLGLTTWFLRPEAMSPLLFVIIVWDGMVALVTGWVLGTWSGRRPGAVAGTSSKGD